MKTFFFILLVSTLVSKVSAQNQGSGFPVTDPRWAHGDSTNHPTPQNTNSYSSLEKLYSLILKKLTAQGQTCGMDTHNFTSFYNVDYQIFKHDTMKITSKENCTESVVGCLFTADIKKDLRAFLDDPKTLSFLKAKEGYTADQTKQIQLTFKSYSIH